MGETIEETGLFEMYEYRRITGFLSFAG